VRGGPNAKYLMKGYKRDPRDNPVAPRRGGGWGGGWGGGGGGVEIPNLLATPFVAIIS
jgi:hypothetical protein